MEDGLDTPDLALLDPEQLGDLPGPVDAVVIEEAEGEHDAAFAVHGHEAPVAHAIDDALEALLELLLAGGAGAAAGQHIHRVLEAHAVLRERVVPLAVIVLEAGEVIVRGFDEFGARHALLFG